MTTPRQSILNTALLWGIAVLLAPAGARADIINGPEDVSTIQDAIDSAFDGDEIVVAPGTYLEAIDSLGKAITVRSADGPEVTIIDDSTLTDCCVANGCSSIPSTATSVAGVWRIRVIDEASAACETSAGGAARNGTSTDRRAVPAGGQRFDASAGRQDPVGMVVKPGHQRSQGDPKTRIYRQFAD
jgi:hypothetical protein